MTESISKDEVKHVASLAKIDLSKDKIEDFTIQFNKCLDLFDTLNEVNTENVSPTYSVTDKLNVYRNDNAEDWHEREEMLDNAPKTKEGFIEVPSIIEEDKKK